MRLIDADALKKRFDDEVPIRPISLTYNKEDVIRAVLDAPTIGGWISVKDKLPEIGEKVLVYSKFGHVSDMTLQRHGGQNGYDVLIFDPHGMKPGTDITHWMPLTKPEDAKE